jgi:hypothetical protein
MRISKEAPFNGVSTRFGLRTIEKYIENLDFIFCHSFPNHRLGGGKLMLHNIVASQKVALSGLGRKWHENRR